MRTKHKKEYYAVLSMACMMVAVLCSCTKGNTRQYGTTTTPATPGVPAAPTPEASSTIYLALGDSYTIGQSVDSADRFPAQTAALLNHDSVAVSAIQYIAATGWTTTNLQAAINTANPQGPFAAVTLLIGVNDQYQQRDTTGYRGRFTTLLNTAVSLAGNHKNHVFVLSIPDYGVTPFGAGYYGISEQVDAFNAINKEVTDAYGIDYIDVTIISRNDAGNAAMLAPDGLHPSGSQYAQWAAALAPVMEKRLK